MNQAYLDTYLPIPTTFEVGRILRTAWARFWIHWPIWVLVPAVSFLLGLVLSLPFAMLDGGIDLVAKPDDGLGFLWLLLRWTTSVLSTAVAIFFEAGILRMTLSAIRGGPVRLGDLFSGGRFVWRLMLAQYLLVMAIGVLFAPFLLAGVYSRSMAVGLLSGVICAVFCVILFIGFAFTPFFIVDRGLGPIAAMRASWALTKGLKTSLLHFWIVTSFVFSIATLLTCGLASFVAGPLWGLALALAYEICTRTTQG